MMKNVKDMMLDCEINTIVAFPGLLANIYDAEIPLLRGIEHQQQSRLFGKRIRCFTNRIRISGFVG